MMTSWSALVISQCVTGREYQTALKKKKVQNFLLENEQLYEFMGN